MYSIFTNYIFNSMKKVFVAIVFIAALSSCKKDYTCVCTIPAIVVDGVTITPESSVEVTAEFTKKDAEEWCEGQGTDICKLK